MCTLQGEDFFIEGLTPQYRARALDLMRQRAKDVDRFIAVSDFYAAFMKDYLRVPGDRISVVPLGVNVKGFDKRVSTSDDIFRVGFMARVAPDDPYAGLADPQALAQAIPDLDLLDPHLRPGRAVPRDGV